MIGASVLRHILKYSSQTSLNEMRFFRRSGVRAENALMSENQNGRATLLAANAEAA
jgi:hypothetical protein